MKVFGEATEAVNFLKKGGEKENTECAFSEGVCLNEGKWDGVAWGRGKKGVGQELSQKAFSEEAGWACLKALIKQIALSVMGQGSWGRDLIFILFFLIKDL